MRRADVVDLIHRLPDQELARVHLVLRAGMNVCIDVVLRLEEHYAVFRGREAGNQDEGRLFFLPFDEIVYAKLERMVRATEVEEWYKDLPKLAKKAGEEDAALHPEVPPLAVQLDPAEIARNNLLERIRAARSVIKK